MKRWITCSFPTDYGFNSYHSYSHLASTWPVSVSFPECLGVKDTSKAGVEKGCIWGWESRRKEGEERYLKKGFGLGVTLNVPSEQDNV